MTEGAFKAITWRRERPSKKTTKASPQSPESVEKGARGKIGDLSFEVNLNSEFNSDFK